MFLEPLEERVLLSITAGGDDTDVLVGDLTSAPAGAKSALDAPQFVDGEILLGFDGEVAETFRGRGAEAALAAAGKLVGPFGLSGGRILGNAPGNATGVARVTTQWQLPPGTDVLDAAAQLSGKPGIAYAEPNWIQQIEITTPNDPDFSQLWGMHDTAGAEADLDGPEAWDISTGSTSIVVADIDTGIDYTHPDLYLNIYINQGEIPAALGTIDDTDGDGLITFYDLNDPGQSCACVSDLNGNGRIDAGDLFADPAWADGNDDDGNSLIDDISGWDFINDDNNPFDDNDHGTHTGGTVGAIGNNATGVVGVNWKVQIMALKFLGAGGSGSTADAIDAVNYVATTPAKLSTNSWGGGGFSTGLMDAIAASRDAGQLFIAAAGNAGTNNDSSPHYPSSYNVENYPNPGDKDNVIAVAAIDANNNKASFSSFGANSVDVASAGVSVLSTIPGGGYAYFDGTSMATPHVSGTAALAWAVDPGAGFEDIKQCIFDSAAANPVPDFTGGTTPILTGGRVNAYDTLQCVGMTATAVSPAAGAIVYTTPPTEFRIRFSHQYNTDEMVGAIVDPSDLSVNGMPADSVDLSDPDGVTVTFIYNAPPVPAPAPNDQGLWTMHIDAGAVDAAPGSGLVDPGLKAFNASFRYDATLLAVDSTTPADGSNVSLPLPNVQIHLNEEYDQASVANNDVSLSQGNVVGFSFVDDFTIEYTLANITYEEQLTIQMAAGALTDTFGNPSAPYSGTFNLDIGTVPYPVPLTPKEPLGSLIYDPAYSGLIGSADDTDSFTIEVDPGQTITVLVQPGAGLRPRVELHDTSGMLGAADASAAGEDALIQAVATPEPPGPPEMYTVVVSGLDGTTDSYTLLILLNTMLEQESNNDTGSAQSIEASFIPLSDSAERGAVLSTIDDTGCIGPDGFGYEACSVASAFEDISATGTAVLQGVDDGFVQIHPRGKNLGFGFSFYGVNYTERDVFVSSNGLITFGAGNSSFDNGDLTGAPSAPTIAALWDDLEIFSSPSSAVYWEIRGSGANQRLIVQWDHVGFYCCGGSITFQAVLSEAGNTIQLNYFDLDTGAAPSGGANATVGTKAAGAQGPNRLPVSVNAGPNQWVGTGVSTLIAPGIAPPPSPDFYAFDVTTGQTVTFAMQTFGGDAEVALVGPAGSVLATSGAGPTNVSEILYNYGPLMGGTYYARVTGAPRVAYNLVVLRGAVFDWESNNTMGAAQALGVTPVALGHIGELGLAWVAEHQETVLLTALGATHPVTAGLTNEGLSNWSNSQHSYFTETAGLDVLATNPAGQANILAGGVGAGRVVYFGLDPSFHQPAGETEQLIRQAVSWAAGSADPIDVLWVGPHTTAWNDGSYNVTQITITQFATQNLAGFDVIYVDGSARESGGLDTLLDRAAEIAAFVQAGGGLITDDGGYFGEPDFSWVPTPPFEVDFYSLTANVGETIELSTGTPAGGSGAFLNGLNPKLELYRSDGTLVAEDDDSGGGLNAMLSYLVPAGGAGTYYVAVRSSDAPGALFSGEYVLAAQISGAVPVTDIGIIALGAPSPVSAGAVVDVDVTVQNVGNQHVGGDIDVTLVSDNGTPGDPSDDIPIGTQTIVGGLLAGASANLSFSWDTTGANVAAHTLAASHNFADANDGNDSASTNVTINAPSLGLSVTEVLPGCMLSNSSMNVTIKGTGFAPGFTIALTGFSGPTPTVSNPVYVDAETITATFTTKNGGPPRDRVGNVQVSVGGSSATGVGIFTVSPTSCPAVASTSLVNSSAVSADAALPATDTMNGRGAVIFGPITEWDDSRSTVADDANAEALLAVLEESSPATDAGSADDATALRPPAGNPAISDDAETPPYGDEFDGFFTQLGGGWESLELLAS